MALMWAGTLFDPNTCRLCAENAEPCVPIISKEGDPQILHKIKRCLPISYSDEDEKPKQICYSCLSKLESSFLLIQTALDAEYKFNSILHQSYTDTLQHTGGKVLLIQGDDKGGTIEHTLTVDPMIDLRTTNSDGTTMWQQLKPPTTNPQQQTIDVNSPATVTVHTEQLSSDSVIVLSKVETRNDCKSEVLGTTSVSTEDGNCSDILLMVELKYKDVLIDGSSKVPTITYATEDPSAYGPYKPNPNRIVEIIRPEPTLQSTSTVNNEQIINTKQQQIVTTDNGKKKHQCTVCQKMFVRRANLNAHFATHSDVKPFSCEICLKQFFSKWDLTLHKRLHSKQFSCEYCDKAFSVKGKLERHRRTHTGEKPFSCPNCPKAFSDKRNLQTHVRCHTGEKPYLCNICNKGFRSKSHLTDHNRVHSVEKPYICHICGKNFKWKPTLNMHLKYHAGELFTCDTCGRKYPRISDLKKHILSHSSQRPFSCDSCGKNFKDVATLRKHIKSHSGEKPFSCYVCGKKFLFQWYLASHLKTHERMTCDKCGSVFTKKSALIQHKKSHIYQCKLCNEEFEFKHILEQHLEHFHGSCSTELLE